MGGRSPSSGSQPTGTPESLPTSPPSNFGSHDHSFTLQAVMELQKSCGALTAQIAALSGQIDRMEKAGTDSANKFDDRIDGLTTSVRDVQSTIKVVTKVGVVLFLLGAAAAGIIWTVTQDAFKDIAKTAINSTIVNTAKPVDSQLARPAPQQP